MFDLKIVFVHLEIGFNAKMSRKRPVQNDFNSLFGMPINIKKQKQKITEINGKTGSAIFWEENWKKSWTNEVWVT